MNALFYFLLFFNCILYFLCSPCKREACCRHPTPVGCCVAAEGGETGRSGSLAGHRGRSDPWYEAGQSNPSSPTILAPIASPSTPAVAIRHPPPIRELLCVFFRLLTISMVDCCLIFVFLIFASFCATRKVARVAFPLPFGHLLV